MATFLWNERPGKWLVRLLGAYAPAITFWRTVISSYSVGLYGELEQMVDERLWKFFQFASNRA